MKIALTGGIACGKSLFAKFLRELGIHVLDADDVVHELEAPDGAAVPAIAARFGRNVLAPDGGIDRPALAARVFSDTAARADLESILFPLVRSRMAGGSGVSPLQITIHIIPLLFESHWETDYDILLCIASPVDLQIARMMTSRGYSRAHAEARLAAQWPVVEKTARCHYTVMNDSTPEHLRDEAQRLVAWLKGQIKHEC
ncbi:MAG: dephospho-CoA kinase [Kiritimatiellae bacterium]|nr:dephospho-CoA kinase [Kiritimatiellia bacterium]